MYHVDIVESEFYDIDRLCRDRISVRDEYNAREKNTRENKRFLRETSFHQWAVHVSFPPPQYESSKPIKSETRVSTFVYFKLFTFLLSVNHDAVVSINIFPTEFNSMP